MGAANLRIKFPTPSGPVALDIFSWVSTLRTCDFVRFMCVRREVVLYVNRGRSGPGGSWEWEAKYLLKSSAFCLLQATTWLPALIDGIESIFLFPKRPLVIFHHLCGDRSSC